jgi:hypothetical protein
MSINTSTLKMEASGLIETFDLSIKSHGVASQKLVILKLCMLSHPEPG